MQWERYENGKKSDWHGGTECAALLSGLITNHFLLTFFSLQRFTQNSVFCGKICTLCKLCVCVLSRWHRRRQGKTQGSQLYQDSIPVYAYKFSLDQTKKMWSINNFLAMQQVQHGSIYTTAFGSIPKAIDTLAIQEELCTIIIYILVERWARRDQEDKTAADTLGCHCRGS